MIAIVAGDYQQAVDYLRYAGPAWGSERYVVVTAPEHLQGAIQGAVYLGGPTELRRRVQDLLEHSARPSSPSA